MAKKKDKAPEAPAVAHPARYWLGRNAIDLLTGVEGVVANVSLQPTGNWMIGIQAPAEAGKVAPELRLADIQAVEERGVGLSDRVSYVETSPAYEIGDRVTPLAVEAPCVVTALHWHFAGCVTYAVTMETLTRDGKPAHTAFLGAELKRASGARSVADVGAAAKAEKATGGPAVGAAVVR